MDRRIVVEHLTGPLAGLLQILGIASPDPKLVLTSRPTIREALEQQKFRAKSYMFAGTKPRYVLYVEAVG